MPVYKKVYINLILLFVTVKLGIHFIANSNYGFHADELLYLAMADHMAWGYNEVSPFIAGISWLSVNWFGDSVFAMRILPTLFGSLTVLMTGLFVIEMGGKRFAITLACMGVLISPSFLASDYFLQPVVFDQFFWSLSAFLVFKYSQTLNGRYLLWLGAAAGLGMLTKYSIALFLFALIAGLLLTRQRRLLLNRTWLFAIAIAFLIFLPNMIWQFVHGLPLLKHLQDIQESSMSAIDPAGFLLQLVFAHGAALSIWSAGLLYLFLSSEDKSFRFLAIAFVCVILLLLVFGGKFYYSFGAFPVLFAAGGKCWDLILKRTGKTVKRLFIAVMVVPALIILPAVVPILPFGLHLRYFDLMLKHTAIRFPVTWEDKQVHATTQFYADMLGWKELAMKTANAYYSIPPADRAKTLIFASNYGEAGAVHHYGKQYALPGVISLNSSFARWVPQETEPDYLVYIGKPESAVLKNAKSFQEFDKIKSRYSRGRGTRIYIVKASAAIKQAK